MSMSLQKIGELIEINRYPVKSFAGESLGSAGIEAYGLYGDRCYAFIDETRQGWDSFVTARTIPRMLAFKAELSDETEENDFPQVKVTAPDGRTFHWNESLLNEMQKHSKLELSMKSYSRQNADLLAVDTGSILIISDAALRKLEAVWGKELDKRRFRANMVVSLGETSIHESDWIGRRLSVGNAELRIDMPCERCSMITIEPDTLERDSSLLKKVKEEMDLNFGVYASVIKPGRIEVGQKVYLSD